MGIAIGSVAAAGLVGLCLKKMVVDWYISQYSDGNNISSIADMRKGTWPNLSYLDLGNNTQIKIKIKSMNSPLYPSSLLTKEFLLITTPL